ncbi:MAG: hypothetical protein JWN37_677 [Candidatus Nomurabacteria bacterium]|nr:hypothetical protein [Candidatus Nomurabacteria bacterium]
MAIHLTHYKKALLVISAVSLLLVLFGYAEIQHMARANANDPQVQISEDIVSALGQNIAPQAITGPTQVDVSKTLAPFVIIYDANGTAVASSAQIGGQIPTPPAGVFDVAKASGENRLTWQPNETNRFAAVIKSYQNGDTNGYVLVARSMREVEARNREALELAIAAWIAMVVISAIGLKIVKV